MVFGCTIFGNGAHGNTFPARRLVKDRKDNDWECESTEPVSLSCLKKKQCLP